MRYKRVFLIVLDSVGIGHAKDAEKFGDSLKSNTFLNIDKEISGLLVDNLEKLGFGDFDNYINIDPRKRCKNSYTMRILESSNGKDTMTGHWEMMGVNTQKPFKTFTETGFPEELIQEIEEKTGHKLIGNYAASGTEIIKELGVQQMTENALIVYTSSDSVLQLAANEAVISTEELYKCCEIARKITLKDEYKVGRIIARPFTGNSPESFVRTPKRHDYALNPPCKTYLDVLKDNNYDVISVGKIADIFNNNGISEAFKTKNNDEGMDKTIEIAKNKDFTGLCFVNLVDFDMEFGHRRNVKGYAECIESFDKRLGELLNCLKEDDLLIITADHGNDPTQPGSDHTRENVPGIFYSKSIVHGKYLGEIESFATLGSTIISNFGLKNYNNSPLIFNNLLNKVS